MVCNRFVYLKCFHTVLLVLPFGPAEDDMTLPEGDDLSSPVVTLPIAFPLFGVAQTTLQVSNSTNKLSHSPSPTVNYSKHCTKQLHFCSGS